MPSCRSPVLENNENLELDEINLKFRLSPRVEDAENNSIESFGDKLKSLDLDGLDDNFEVVESTKKKDQIKVKGKGFTKSEIYSLQNWLLDFSIIF